MEGHNINIISELDYKDLTENERMLNLGNGVYNGILRIYYDQNSYSDYLITRCLKILMVNKYEYFYINDKKIGIREKISASPVNSLNVDNWCGKVTYTSPHGLNLVNYSPDLEYSNNLRNNVYYTLYYTFIYNKIIYTAHHSQFFHLFYKIDLHNEGTDNTDFYHRGSQETLEKVVSQIESTTKIGILILTVRYSSKDSYTGHAMNLIVDTTNKKFIHVNSHHSSEGKYNFEQFFKRYFGDYQYVNINTGMQKKDGYCIFWSKLLELYFVENLGLVNSPETLLTILFKCYQPVYPEIYNDLTDDLTDNDTPTKTIKFGQVERDFLPYVILFEKLFYYFVKLLRNKTPSLIKQFLKRNNKPNAMNTNIYGFDITPEQMVEIDNVFIFEDNFINTYMCDIKYELLKYDSENIIDMISDEQFLPSVVENPEYEDPFFASDEDDYDESIPKYIEILNYGKFIKIYKYAHTIRNYSYLKSQKSQKSQKYDIIYTRENIVIVHKTDDYPCIIIVKKDIKQIVIIGEYENNIKQLDSKVFADYERVALLDRVKVSPNIKMFMIHYIAMLAIYNDNLDFIDYDIFNPEKMSSLFYNNSIIHFYSMYRNFYKGT